VKKILLILLVTFLIPDTSSSFFSEKWQGRVYPDRTNLSNSISIGKDFKSLSDCRKACLNKINVSGYKNADYECGLNCKPLYPNIPDSVMVCKKTER
jgi:hypothetical protein